ncbi:MAG: arginine repressor [Thermoanaerobaculales bacterium]
MPRKGEGWRMRREAIEEILGQETIHQQSDLVERLALRGFAVTQSSVSRDLQEIGAARVDGRYLPAAALAGKSWHGTRLAEIAAFLLSWVATGPHLLVVKTPPGLASSAALALDQAGWLEVIGTVAGDDTFFVATAGRRQQARLEAHLAQIRKEVMHA